MPELTPNIVSDVLAACQAGASEAASALSRALDNEFKLSAGEPGTLSASALPDELSAPGLAIVLTIGSGGAVLVLPESTGLLPDWYGTPDPTGQSKLTTLAQELGACFLPDAYYPDNFKTARAANLADALRSGGLADDAAMVPLVLSGKDDKQGTALLVWPVSQPDMVLSTDSGKQENSPQSAVAVQTKSDTESVPQPRADSPRRRADKREFPPYTRSLLRVRVPVVVTLAKKKQPLGKILEIGPGQIIQFEKSCEEMLDLEAGDCLIATGEAVKVGDKFGLRIMSILPPEERFVPVRKC